MRFRLSNQSIVMLCCTVAICLVLAGLLIPPTPVYKTHNPNCVLAYNFEEGSGTLAEDQTQFNNDGTISSAVYSTTSAFGNYSLYFDGNDKVQCSTLDNLDGDISLSVFAWINHSDGTLNDGIIAKDDNQMRSWILHCFSPSKFRVIINDDDSTLYTFESDSILSNNVWYFVGFVYDTANNSVNLYLNGVLHKSYSYTGIIKDGNDDVYIGWYFSDSYGFNGEIDNPQIFSEALTEIEINQLYQNGLDLLITQQVSYFYWYQVLTPTNVGLFFAVIIPVSTILIVVYKGVKRITKR